MGLDEEPSRGSPAVSQPLAIDSHAQGAPEPLVSVVMCAYNARPYIEAAVNSILDQTFKDWELIISDDCSTDGTREWLQGLEGDPRIRLFLQERNLGYVGNKNFAHQQARGLFITQQDNDDLCPPDRLAKQVAVMRANDEIKLVACGYLRVDQEGREIDVFGPTSDMLISAPWEGIYPFWFPSLLVHRSVFDRVGWFSPYFSGVMGDDLYWTVRAHEAFPIFCLHKPLYSYRFNPDSITNVLDKPRKLIITAVMDELFRQRREAGTDWLEQGDLGALATFEERLLQDKRYMAEQYRIWAAKAVDKGDLAQARKLLGKAFSLHAAHTGLMRTAFYLARRTLSLP